MPIAPPNCNQPPKWTQTLIAAANRRNRARASPEVYSMADLDAAWEACGGCCAFSGLPFSLQVYGDGQAKRPFAPSLDRIDRHQPYQQNNVRLVTAVANFAMNAWGDEPVLQMASALHQKSGSHLLSTRPAPSDGDLDEAAVVDNDLVETDAGILAFPSRSDMCGPILTLLEQGPRSSRELEDALAERFGITTRMRAIVQGNGCPAWRNHVAWVLVNLGKHDHGTGQIERIKGRIAPDGGSMGIYRLECSNNASQTPI